jgi:AraC-like DNA-binding protein
MHPDRRRAATSTHRSDLFREATALIQSDFARAITLQETAARVSASPRQVRRAFAEVGGTTFRAYVHDVRMARAAELLASTETSVREIGARVGYTQPSQFTKAFKRFFGLTPTRFKLIGGLLVPSGQLRATGESAGVDFGNERSMPAPKEEPWPGKE